VPNLSSLDLPTAIGTLIAAPIVYYMLRKLGKWLLQVVRFSFEGVLWFVGRFAFQQLAARLSMRRYCRAQLGAPATSSLPVPGASSIALDTDQVFVPLALGLGARNSEPYTNANVLSAGNRLLVVGDPGSGKSSLVKRLFRDACRLGISASAKARLPVHIELKNLKPPNSVDEKAAAEWLIKTLRDRVIAVHGYDMGQLFDSSAESVGLLILLDGLDEVSSDRYQAVELAIKGLGRLLTGRSEHNTVVVTMRVQFHQQVGVSFEDDYPKTLYIRPFSPNDIYTFLTRWPFGRNAETMAAGIYADLTDRPTLREMCSNPLVLAMYVANHQSVPRGEMADSRTDFYRKVVDELLVLRRRRQEVTVGSNSLREQRESLLGALALDNLVDSRQSANALSWSKAIDVASRAWRCDEAEAETRLRQLASETGIISEERPGETFRFIHLTFCEFLAAKESSVGRENGWEELIASHLNNLVAKDVRSRSRLVETIPFATALLPRVARDAALSRVAELADAELLGRCLLEVQSYEHEAWNQYLSGERAYLMSRPAGPDAEWLRRLHLFNVVLRDAKGWAETVAQRSLNVDLDELYKNLLSGDESLFVDVFVSYAAQDAAAAFRLANSFGIDILHAHPDVVIESCQEPPFLAIALDYARKLDEDSTQWDFVLTEAGLRFANVSARLAREPRAGTRWAGADYEDWSLTHGENFARIEGLWGGIVSSAVKAGVSRRDNGQTAVDKVRFIKPPAKLRSAPLLLVGVAVCMVALSWYCFTALDNVFTTAQDGDTPFLALLLIACADELLLLTFMSYIFFRRRVYAELLNLRPSGSALQSGRPFYRVGSVIGGVLLKPQMGVLRELREMRGESDDIETSLA
jgi:hypothetical protein